MNEDTLPAAPTQPMPAYNPPDNPPPPRKRSNEQLWYIAALIFAATAAAAIGFFGGTSLEGNQAEETLAAITQSVNESQQSSTQAARTATAIARAFTDTPSPTFTETSSPSPTVTATFTSTATPEIPIARAVSIITTVRLGPDENFPVVGQLAQDSQVEITEISADGLWVRVNYVNGQGETVTGFVRADSLQLMGGTLANVAIASFPTLTTTPSPTFTATTTPSTTASPTSTATATFTATATQTALPTVTATPSSTPTLTPTATPTVPVVSAAGYFLVVREGPSESFNAIGVVDSTTQLQLVGVSPDGAWFQVFFEESPTDFGWVSAQVVEISGNFSNLPVVQAPPLPTPVAVITQPADSSQTGETVSGEVGSTSAGSVEDIVPAALPTNFNINYDQLPGLDAYAYELAFSINATADGLPYNGSLEFLYAKAGDQERLQLDVSDALQNLLSSDDEELAELLPLTVGTYRGEGYLVFVENDAEICLALGARATLSEIVPALQEFGGAIEGVVLELQDIGVFGVVDSASLLGIDTTHYQLLGIGTAENFSPNSALKADLWWNADESLLVAFRISLGIDEEGVFRAEDLGAFDPEIQNYTIVEGEVNLYLLPLGINDRAVSFTVPPAICNEALGIQ